MDYEEESSGKNTENIYLSDSECKFLYKIAKKVPHNEEIVQIGEYQSNSLNAG
jgi:hypothetical protein